MKKETLSTEVLNLINSWSNDYEREIRYTKVEQFGDIDATFELDLFKDDEF